MDKRAWRYVVFMATLIGTTLTVPLSADVQPGDVITNSNVEKAAALLTPATRWMVDRGMSMTVRETKKVVWPQAYREATQKYAEHVQVTFDGGRLFGYVAGCPFPVIDLNDPQAGAKIMWNVAHNPFSVDNIGTEMKIEVIGAEGAVNETYETLWRRLLWLGRLYSDPKPVLPHNPPLHYSQLWGPLTKPSSKAGLAMLLFRYAAPDRPDDMYVYYPITRRVHRTTNGGRGDVTWGTDIDTDSLWGFNGKLNYWTFRVLAEKDILAVVHSGKYSDKSVWCAPRDSGRGLLAALPCVHWEKRRVWVVEGTPGPVVASAYRYSKRILYVDQDFSAPVIEEMHDPDGELWRFFVPCFFFYPKQPYWRDAHMPAEAPKGEEWAFLPNGLWVDIQGMQATTFEAPPSSKNPWEMRAAWYFNEDAHDNVPEIYTLQHLARGGR